VANLWGKVNSTVGSDTAGVLTITNLVPESLVRARCHRKRRVPAPL